MTVKTTGHEWKRYYADPIAWPEGSWHEYGEITVNGAAADDEFDLTSVPDNALMTIKGGNVIFSSVTVGPTLEAHFKAWRKRQATVTLLVYAPSDRAEAVRAAIIAAGGKVAA